MQEIPEDCLKEKIVFQFWTDSNPIPQTRLKNIELFPILSGGMKNILVHTDNLGQFLKHLKEKEKRENKTKTRPLHRAYSFLSSVHKSDYLRAYFGYYFGGGYMDIKEPLGSWHDAWQEFVNSDDEIYLNSAPNLDRFSVPGQLGDETMDAFGELPCVAVFLCKRYNPIMKEWLDDIEAFLDANFENLKLYPASHSCDRKEDEGSKYCVGWNILGANFFHRIVFEKYRKNIMLTMPYVCQINYR